MRLYCTMRQMSILLYFPVEGKTKYIYTTIRSYLQIDEQIWTPESLSKPSNYLYQLATLQYQPVASISIENVSSFNIQPVELQKTVFEQKPGLWPKMAFFQKCIQQKIFYIYHKHKVNIRLFVNTQSDKKQNFMFELSLSATLGFYVVLLSFLMQDNF